MAEVETPLPPGSRFRPTYRALTDDEKAQCDAIKSKAAELEGLIEDLAHKTNAPGAWRNRTLALEALEVSVMWTIKGITA